MRFYMAAHALIEKDGCYLVIRRSASNNYMPLKWDIPGGVVKAGESLEDSIHREVHEETKLEVDILSVEYIYSNRDQIPKRQTFQAIYRCKYICGNVSLNPLEHDKFGWVDLEQMAKLDLIAFLKNYIKPRSQF